MRIFVFPPPRRVIVSHTRSRSDFWRDFHLNMISTTQMLDRINFRRTTSDLTGRIQNQEATLQGIKLLGLVGFTALLVKQYLNNRTLNKQIKTLEKTVIHKHPTHITIKTEKERQQAPLHGSYQISPLA
jgi:hypothetical protein